MNNDLKHITPGTLHEAQTRLKQLAGVWEGQGQGFFPTISDFEYVERFKLRWDRDVFVYEQTTDKREKGKSEWEPGHREYGFLHLFESHVEINNCQNGGRVEWLKGPWYLTTDGLQCHVEAKGFGNDPRMLRSKRIIRIHQDSLSYELHMATGSKPELTHHLSNTLFRKG